MFVAFCVLLALLPIKGLTLGLLGDEPIELQQNFRLGDYCGRWYEIYRTVNIPFESGTDIQMVFTSNEDGTVTVMNEEYLPDEKKWNVAMATAYVVGNAHLQMLYSPKSPPCDYRILHTDYSGISLVYSESPSSSSSSMHYGWILSRTPKPGLLEMGRSFAVFKERTGLDRSRFRKTPHGVAPASGDQQEEQLVKTKNAK